MIQTDMENSKACKQAISFSKDFNPQNDIDYSWVYDHAIFMYNEITDIIRHLDTKAETIIRYLAPGSGLISIALVWFSSLNQFSSQLAIKIMAIGGLIFLIISMVTAFYSLLPHHSVVPPSVKTAIQTAEYYKNKDKSLAFSATGIEIAFMQKRVVATLKGRYLQASYWLYIIGSISIAIGMLFAIC